jgi:hypothetical protein
MTRGRRRRVHQRGSAGRAAEENNAMSVRNAMKAMIVVGGLLLAATPAGAMTGQEFLQAFDGSAHDESAVMKPLVRQFVKEGLP